MSSTTAATAVRPTKKQRELLTFIEKFIGEHGYSPSYREIMNGLSYTSVATVALHINSLITRGHLHKRDRSARSLEVVKETKEMQVGTTVKASEEKWLVERIEHYFQSVEQNDNPAAQDIDQLYVLIGALKVLGLDGAHRSFVARLSALESKNAVS